MILEINDKLTFSSLYKIPLIVNPNYEFSSFIEDQDFKITIRTYTTGATRLSVELDGVRIIDNAPICIYAKNLNCYSDFTKGCFFFIRNNSKIHTVPTFENFVDNDLELYYGNF